MLYKAPGASILWGATIPWQCADSLGEILLGRALLIGTKRNTKHSKTDFTFINDFSQDDMLVFPSSIEYMRPFEWPVAYACPWYQWDFVLLTPVILQGSLAQIFWPNYCVGNAISGHHRQKIQCTTYIFVWYNIKIITCSLIMVNYVVIITWTFSFQNPSQKLLFTY